MKLPFTGFDKKAIAVGVLSIVPILVFGSGEQTDNPIFEIDKRLVDPNEAVRLTWSWPGAEKGYLSSFGIVNDPKSGTRVLRTNESTDLVLILEGKGQSVVLSTRISVRGAKGDEERRPDANQPFTVENKFNAKNKSLVELANAVTSALQNKLGYEVRTSKQEPEMVVLHTAFSQGRVPIPSSQGPSRWIRKAVRVEIQKQINHDSIEVAISIQIDFRLVNDERWFKEPPQSSPLYHQAMMDVKAKMGPQLLD